LVASCADCGFDNPPDHRFCGSCGAALGAAPASAQPAAPTATERRVVTVLFIDLVGFTSFSEGRDPEDVRSLITEYFDVARDVIERFGGTVDKFIGDAVMAWWGATTSQEDDAERAVRSALEVVDAVTSLGERLGVADLAARAGVMTGEVAVGPGGNEKGLLLGDLVNTTSRIQSLAHPGSVLIGDVTASLVGRAIELEAAGTHSVKGKEQPVVAWEATRVLSERGGRGRLDVLEPPFVGRASELRLLKDTLTSTGRDRRARLVSLVGQAGIGKSRLIREFSNYVDGLVDDIYWHEGRSPSYGDGLALWALGEMIRGRAGIQETDSPEVTAEKLGEAVDTFVADGDAAWVRERLAGLLGVGESAGSERTELFAAARAFFEGIAAEGTTVLVFEDLHWADPSLLEFVEDLPDWSRNHPIMVVTMARPDLLDRRPDWGSGRPGFASLYLGPLGSDEMAELIAGAVEGIPNSAVARIVEAAEGVPLFAVEMLRMLMSDGRLVIGEGGVSVQGDLTEIDVPSSVQAVISARLDRLPQTERDLARDAAVLGQSFTIEGLAILREESLDKLERRLADLVRHEVLTLVRDPRSPELGQYQWVQGMLREVAYGRIARADRHDLHRRVARYYLGLDEPELAPVAAAHYVSASEFAADDDPDLREELIAALQAAIDRARALHAHEQILSLVELALPVASPELAVDLHEYGALAAVRLSAAPTAERHTDALAALAVELDDVAVLHRSMAIAGRVANALRRSESVKQLLIDHVDRYPDLDADPYLAWAAVDLARVHLLTGDDEAAATLADRALAAVEKLDLIEAIADAMITRGTALSATRYHQAMALLRGALDLCTEHGLIDTKLRALINIGYASQALAETFEATGAAYEESKRVGDRNHASFVAGNLAGGMLYQLRLDEADEILADPVWSSEPSDQLQRLALLADLELRRGNRERADSHLAATQELLAQVTDAQARLAVERLQATFAMVDGDPRTVYETAVRHFEETTFVPGIAVSLAVLGASLMADLERLRRVLPMAESLPPGVFNTPSAWWAHAMIDLVEGRAAEGFAQAEDLLVWIREQGLVWQEFLTLITVAPVLTADHEARSRYLARIEELTVPAGALGLWDWARSLLGAAD
jgi:class 3 adenylate cyclase/tetratricopeptide (TPR) repeat protein